MLILLGISLARCLAADIATAQYDNSRTLWNGSELYLNISNVNAMAFGKIFTKPVDALIYAQPLYLENVTIPNRGVINVVYVATMNNTIYAFDADNPNAATVWSANLGPPDTSVPFGPIGILSTPVIVRDKQAIYAVAATFENNHRVYRLHALDLLTGAEKFGGPVVISGAVAGSAADAQNGILTFDPDKHNQRVSLAVAGNSVYLAAAGMFLPFHGWVFGYDISSLQQTAVYCDTANGTVGGIWQAGRAPAVDASGALYFETGDGDFDGVSDFGDTLLKLSSAGTVLDWFTPDNWSTLDQNDWDLGSSGPLLIPGSNRLIAGSKAGMLYVLDPTNLGHTQPGNGQIVQNFQATPGCTAAYSCAEILGQAFWNHATRPMLYVWGWRDVLKAYPFVNGQLDTAHVSSAMVAANYPGGQLAVSSNGSTAGTGLLWAVTADRSDSENLSASPGTLHAFDATDITHELWNSGQNASRDALGNFAKFVSPVVANGKVYAATFSNQLVVYGLLPSLSIAKTHAGNFTQGQQSATYTVTVSNAVNSAATSGTVTMTETPPAGMTVASMTGTGWTCGTATCTRSDALAGGSSYPAITVTVNVAPNASSPQINQVSVTGGGSAGASASDSTTVINAPALSLAKTHTANFTQGQQNANYTVTVSNAANSAPTSGTVTMTETPPAGMTVVSMAGTGWVCGTVTCTRSDALAGGSNYPTITVTVNVALNAISPLVNQVSVSGGGSASASASDSTTIIAIPQEPRFFNWTNNIAQGQLSQRGTLIAGIQSVAAAEARKTAVRAKILQLIGGLPQSSAPLNPQITGTIDMGSYSIQKILFESTPGLIVSALLYLPKMAGPLPAVLFQIGHFDGGKSYDQTIPGNLAMKGFVVLAFDPIGEGERVQGYNPATGTGLAADAVQQHLMAGAQSSLMAQNYARYEIFDAQRAIDYLVSRPEVDATRIGATGCSGGGTLTTYLAMLDSRIKAAAPACYANSYQILYPENFIGDSEQSFSGILSSGLDIPDFVELFSPKPFLICSTQQDFTPLASAQIVYNEASQWYGLYGAASNLQWVVGPGGHGTPLEVRQAIYAWMIQWLNNNIGDSTEQTVTTLAASQLLASATGQVGGLQIYQVIGGTPRTQGSRADLTALLNQAVAHSPQTPPTTITSQTDNGTFATQSISFTTEPGLTLDAQVMIPDTPGVKPAVVFVEGAALGSAGAAQLAAAGSIVLDLLPRGLPTQAGGGFPGDWVTNVRALLIGRSLPGMRAYDILQGVEILAARNDVDRSRITGVASGVPGVWLLLAAASDTRISSIQLDGTPYSFMPAMNGPVHYNLYDAEIDGFFLKFDVVDLLTALSGRPVFWTNPTDWLHNSVPQVSALAIAASHAGNFTQGQQHATYSVTVSNAPAAMMTGGAVSVTASLPSGLTPVSMAGTGWSCGATTCTRGDVLPPRASYPTITATVNVTAAANSPQLYQVSVSGGGSATTSASDTTTIISSPTLSIVKTHTGNFTQGQQNASYTATVSNAVNSASTSGTVVVTETPPAGMTVVSMSGTGWTCGTATCTRSDPLAGGSSYPAISVKVNVAANAASPLINQVSASGGGSATASASDSTLVNGPATPVSVAPNTGSGSSQVFTFMFADPIAAANIVSATVAVGPVLSQSGSCYVYLARGSNQLFLADDAGGFHVGLPVGVAGTASNNQCVLDAGASSVQLSGNTLTLNLALRFQAASAGAKNIYMEVFNGFDSGWVLRGTWTVMVSSLPDFTISLTPGTQSTVKGGSSNYTVTIASLNGFSGAVSFAASGLPSGATATLLPSTVTGSGSAMMTINTSAAGGVGNFTLSITGTSGALNHSTSALLTVTNTSPPTAVSVAPNTGSGSSQTFAFQFSDPAGATNIASTTIEVAAVLTQSGSCYVYFARGSNLLFLADDAGIFHSGLTPGAAGTASNDQCTLNAGASSVMLSGNTLTLNLALSFKPAYAGARNIYMEAFNGLDSGFVQRGTWTAQ